MGLVEKTFYQVVVAGTDISSVLSPILIDMSVSLTSGSSSDSASITIDDTGGRVAIPPKDSPITILLSYTGGGFSEVFRGKVDTVNSKGGRDGRTLSITCSGMGTTGKAKQPRSKHYDKKKVKDILQDAAKAAGYGDVQVDAEIGDIELDYFLQLDTSFIHLGQNLARDFGGTFKVMGEKVVMVKRSAGRSATGKPLVTVNAVWGDNLMNWDISPTIGRPRHKKAKAKWYDKTKAKWVTETADTQDGEAQAETTARFSVASETEAKKKSKSVAEEADREKGSGSVTINGNPTALPEARCNVSGARPGIDGTYTIDGVTHNVSRSGFTTALTIKKPEGGAGVDNR